MSNSVNLGVVRLPEVLAQVAIGKSTIYSLISRNEFPKPVQLCRRAVGWRQRDIDAWLESRTVTGKGR